MNWMNSHTKVGIQSNMPKVDKALKAPQKEMEKSRAKVILKNTGALSLSTVLGKIFYFLLFILIGRYLGPSDLGKFTFALSFIGMFAVVNDLGLNILTVRDVAKDKN
jgi:O-antigen/teichoic acid export membrane protein